MQLVQFECPNHSNSWVSSILKVGRISLFSVLALWGNKNWTPSIKVKQIEISQNKMGLKGCKWSSMNAPGTRTPLSHPFLELDFSPFSLLALWGNKKWPPSIKVKQIEIFQNKMGSKCCKWSSLNSQGLKLLCLIHFMLDFEGCNGLMEHPHFWLECEAMAWRRMEINRDLRRISPSKVLRDTRAEVLLLKPEPLIHGLG